MFTRVTGSAFVIALFAFGQEAPQGQQPADFKGVQRKNLAPVSNEILRVKLPKPIEAKLRNGITLMVIEDHRAPTVTVDLSIPASSYNQPPELPALADATAALMRLGTKTRDSRQIAETLAELGASLFVSTGQHSFDVRFSTLTENLDAVLDLFADVLLNPSFPADELDKWKTRQLSSLQQIRSQPGFLANERMQQVLYPGDPRSVVAPTPESVRKITREAILEFYNANFRPAGGLIGVAGDTTPKQIAAKLEKALGSWKGAPPKLPELPLREPLAEKKVIVVHRPGSVQTTLLVANRAIDRRSPDYIASNVMNRVLGQGPAARLFRNIREEKGYTYGIGSGFNASYYSNHFSASMSVRTEVTGPALEELLKEFRDIRDRPVPADELGGAKRALVASFALSLENSGNSLRNAMLAREYGFPADYWDTYPMKLEQVTAAEVQRVAKQYVPVDNVQIVAVGDATKIRSVLEKFGPVEEWDAEGNRVSAAAATAGDAR
jgi:predicted Zn-dependent peptidase